MASWRLARALQVLTTEIRTVHPGTTVWSIGDEDHQNGYSDHNPNASGVVCAIDVLGDRGLDLDVFARYLAAHPHPAVKYVIHNGQIWSRARAGEGWRKYTGSNPHRTHVHVSVGTGPDGRSTGPYDNASPWGIADLDDAPSKPSTPQTPSTNWTAKLVSELPSIKQGSRGSAVRRAQALILAYGGAPAARLKSAGGIDGILGSGSVAAVKLFQKAKNLVQDGIIGPKTWSRLVKG
ncbi:peptidoglycan-binding domain-containing protein [Glycomyces sp. NPDC047010]|uniref:peptidoglycan-binding domain-containing protein n=1 Tax=Glycomyces sp. NPDC047010 TaxID=3155023 RepID=UPI0033FBA26D